MSIIADMTTSKSEINIRSALKLSALLSDGTPIVLDGALATYLETLGADISGVLWSAQILLLHPELIYRAHLDYYRAGANVAITASYQASTLGLVNHLRVPEEEATDIIVQSVQIAKRARDDYINSVPEHERDGKRKTLLVAGSVGPYGAYLADGSEYRGDYSITIGELQDFHRSRIAALVGAGVDVLACETIPSELETKALLELLSTEFPGIEAWFSFTLRDENHISDGTPLSHVAILLSSYAHVVAVGINCVPEALVLGALKELRKSTIKPLIVYPNSGEEWDAENRTWKGDRSNGTHLVHATRANWDAGARLIGGCCRTTPDDIAVISETLRDVSK